MSGQLCEKKARRYTPAGLPVVEARVDHESSVREAQIDRTVKFEVRVKAVGPIAERLEAVPLGQSLRMKGFLAPVRLHSRQIQFHLTDFELE